MKHCGAVPLAQAARPVCINTPRARSIRASVLGSEVNTTPSRPSPHRTTRARTAPPASGSSTSSAVPAGSTQSLFIDAPPREMSQSSIRATGRPVACTPTMMPFVLVRS